MPSVPALGNRVYSKDNLITVEVVGVQSQASVSKMGNQIQELARSFRGQRLPVLILDDLRAMAKKQPSEVGRTVAEVEKRLDYDKLAMLGDGNPMLRYGSNFIIRAIGKNHKLRYFDHRSAAVAWLRS